MRAHRCASSLVWSPEATMATEPAPNRSTVARRRSAMWSSTVVVATGSRPRPPRISGAGAGPGRQVAGDALGETGAAMAEDAALAVELDQRRDRHGLVVGALGQGHPRAARAVAEGQVLQRALPALVADRAVERVVEQEELEHRVLPLPRPVRARVHD